MTSPTGTPAIRRGVSIRLFLADGTPDGLWVVEKSNWTGVGLLWPRALHPHVRGRKELERGGVYVLVGEDDASGKPRVYVGEAEVLWKRLDQQYAGRDFWTHAVAFTSKDGSLNKAHAKYLEARLLALAQLAQQALIENGNVPVAPALSEAETADTETFLDEMLVLYPVLDVRAFLPVEAAAAPAERLHLEGPEAIAEGEDTAEGFVVLAGSLARGTVVQSIHAYITALREKLVEDGVLAPQADGRLSFTQDFVFNSPSLAAAVLLGRTANGREEWKDAGGRTLKEIQTAAVTSVPEPV